MIQLIQSDTRSRVDHRIYKHCRPEFSQQQLSYILNYVDLRMLSLGITKSKQTEYEKSIVSMRFRSGN
jgi:hypothetical protein